MSAPNDNSNQSYTNIIRECEEIGKRAAEMKESSSATEEEKRARAKQDYHSLKLILGELKDGPLQHELSAEKREELVSGFRQAFHTTGNGPLQTDLRSIVQDSNEGGKDKAKVTEAEEK